MGLVSEVQYLIPFLFTQENILKKKKKCSLFVDVHLYSTLSQKYFTLLSSISFLQHKNGFCQFGTFDQDLNTQLQYTYNCNTFTITVSTLTILLQLQLQYPVQKIPNPLPFIMSVILFFWPTVKLINSAMLHTVHRCSNLVHNDLC